ncbi:conserved hypothetical protein [Aspergillus terreus NIH2624]|uniref:Phosphoribosylaminoimidazole-succinocarboxamide synthase n=1 Tax=Aspergillus terreus (strain NIH 2624 / FGSC A1156) TaxID=341663 RepID=Q0CX62_ASPTN|nr:uncharacterized protein ATEG_01722 [Aspergillus terreus NIH2624]EAU38479.1 conserved hypothetical protein [Aspergillus terreus NIH2624]
MLAPGSGNVSLRTVSSSRPQLHHSQSQQSIAASDDYYSFSDRHTSSRSASNGSSQLTIVRYATPNSHPVSRTASPAVSRANLVPPAPVSRSQQSVNIPDVDGPSTSQAQRTMRQTDEGSVRLNPVADHAMHQLPSDSYAGRPPTPGVDDSPYLRFAINQLTRDDDQQQLGRQSSIASSISTGEHVVWDEELGYFRRAPEISRATSSQQPYPQQTKETPVDRPPQNSVDIESFVPVDPPDDSLLYPPLDYVPTVLRPWALALVILCCLLMIAGIAFCNVWSEKHQGIWDYHGQGGARYFVVEFLPQILAVIITIWTFVVQAAVYRTIPFAIMASERPLGRVLQGMPVLSQNFLVPDLSHFVHGEPVVGLALSSIWLSNMIAIPLLSCFFQAKWFVIDGQGVWRWTAVIAVGWTLVAVYALLTIGLLMLMFRFVRTWSGLMWDPVCLADLISVIQRSNILHDFEHSETVPDVGETLDPRPLRLGYWRLSTRSEIFYGIGEVDAPIGTPSLHRLEKNRAKQPHGLSKVAYDVEQQGSLEKDACDGHLYSPAIRYRWVPWFLRRPLVLSWTVIIAALFIAFVVVSFIHDAIQGGFPPKLPTLPSTGAFSSSNFLYSFIPAFIGNLLFLSWQHIDVHFRALQPFATLSAPEGATAERSLLLSYPSCLPFQVTVLALLNKHYKVAWISLVSMLSGALPILAGGVFIALWYPTDDEIRIASLMPAFYALVAFCAIYTVSFLAIWPRRCRHLPHAITTLADQISFLYQSPLLSDKLLREPRSKADLITRLVMAPPGDREYPTYGFGIYVGRDGKEHLGIDRFHRPGRADMLITTGSMK